MRGIAALNIAFIVHGIGIFPRPEMLAEALHLPWPIDRFVWWAGHMGSMISVDLFFCLSGFVFYYKYRQKIAEGKISLGEYFILRFSRLYPIHWLLLIGLSSMLIIGGGWGAAQRNIYNFILNALLISDLWQGNNFVAGAFIGSTWSLTYEIAAYFIFFALALKSSRKYGKLIFLGPIMLALIANQVNYSGIFAGVPLMNFLGERVLVSFFIGCFTSELHKYLSSKKRMRYAITAVSALLCLLLPYLSHIDLERRGGIIFGTGINSMEISFQLIGLPALILLALNLTPLSKILSLKIFEYLGNISYSVYLWHLFFIEFMFNFLLSFCKIPINSEENAMFSFYCWIVATLLFSTLSYYFFEVPVQNRIRKAYYRSFPK